MGLRDCFFKRRRWSRNSEDFGRNRGEERGVFWQRACPPHTCPPSPGGELGLVTGAHGWGEGAVCVSGHHLCLRALQPRG